LLCKQQHEYREILQAEKVMQHLIMS
jgi:hypothetical protein